MKQLYEIPEVGIYAVYPYFDANKQEGEDITLTVPAFQISEEGSFGRGAYPFVGRSKDTNIAFYDKSECGTRTITSSVEVKRSIFGSIENLDNDVAFAVGIGRLSISTAAVLVTPMSVVQLSLTIQPSDANYEWIKWSSSDKTIATVDEDGMVVIGKKEGTCTITATSDNGKSASCTVYVDSLDQGLVDLGLSVKWASVNLGASKPEEFGRYFAYGDVVGQTWDWDSPSMSWSGGGFYDYPSYELDSRRNLKPEYDAAHVILGDKWRMPTVGEIQELIDNCTSARVSNNGFYGMLFTSKKTGRSIFLPSAGYGYQNGVCNPNFYGYYWSSTLDNFAYPWYFELTLDQVYTFTCPNSSGYSIRPVSE